MRDDVIEACGMGFQGNGISGFGMGFSGALVGVVFVGRDIVRWESAGRIRLQYGRLNLGWKRVSD